MLSGGVPAMAENGYTESGSEEEYLAEQPSAETSPSELSSAVQPSGESAPEGEGVQADAGGTPADTAEDNQVESALEEGGSSAPASQDVMEPASDDEEELSGEEEDAEEVVETAGENEWTEGAFSASVSAEDDGVDNEELLENYIQQCFDEALPASSFSKLYSRPHTDYNLSPVMSAILASLKTEIKKIAAGTRTSTSIELTPAKMGISAVTTVDAYDVYDAVDAVFGSDYSIDVLHEALLSDCPYELYWYDKTGNDGSFSALSYYPHYTYTYLGSGKSQLTVEKCVFQFLVAEEYQGSNIFSVKSSTGQTVKKAVSNAKAIVTKYTGTYNKDTQASKLLTAYKDEICSITDYNWDAVEYDYDYGNPWQLVWVFDGNASTKVVCEGYSKAFEYLCNLTGFSTVNCYTVTGWMYQTSSGFKYNSDGHMWNIVTMGDGCNYLADVTNCDGNTGTQPFLTGYISGSVWDGYVFRVGSTRFTYRYDDNMWDVYTPKDLTLSSHAYGKSAGSFSKDPSVLYYAKIAGNREWTEVASDGEMAGTTGQSKIMESFMIEVTDPDSGEMLDPSILGVEYSGHVQNVGWESYVSNGEICGRPGKNLRIEAIRMRLTGELADQYDIYYCMHCQNYGWLAWAKNDTPAGTAGMSLRVEAIRIRIVEKGSTAPSNLSGWTKSFLYSPTIYYASYVEGSGWQSEVTKGKISGTSGQSLKLEGIKIRVSGEANLGVRYEGHVQNAGWETTWRTDGQISGDPDKARRIEAFRLELTGADKNKYDIYYCLHVQNFGWLAWAKNGEDAGSSGVSMRVEAYVIKILPKGSARPQNYSSQTKAFVEGVGATSLTLSRKTAAISKGGKVTLTATVLPANRTFKGVTWKSSNTAVATVSGGVVTGKKKGTCTITCTSNDGRVKATCTITVK